MNMKRRLNCCRDQRERVSLLASNSLPEAERAPVRAHLAQCAQCREYYEEMAGLTGELQEWARMENPVEAGAAFRARWMREIENADAHERTWWTTVTGIFHASRGMPTVRRVGAPGLQAPASVPVGRVPSRGVWAHQLFAILSRWREWLWPSPTAWGGLAAVWACLVLLHWATPARPASGPELAKRAPRDTVVTLAQRQRELASLLDSLAPPAPPSRPETLRPRSQRRAETVRT